MWLPYDDRDLGGIAREKVVKEFVIVLCQLSDPGSPEQTYRLRPSNLPPDESFRPLPSAWVVSGCSGDQLIAG